MVHIYSVGEWKLNGLECSLDQHKMVVHLKTMESALTEFSTNLKHKLPLDKELNNFSRIIKQMDSLESYLYCASSMQHTGLDTLNKEVIQLRKQFKLVSKDFKKEILKLDIHKLEDWLRKIEMNSFQLEIKTIWSTKEQSDELLTSYTEDTLRDLENLYKQLLEKITIRFEEKEYNFQEMNQIVYKHKNSSKRARALAALNQALEVNADAFSNIYIQIVRLRLFNYRSKKAHFLDQSLQSNGISLEALNAMWASVDKGSDRLKIHLLNKKSVLNKDTVSWNDLATVESDSSSVKITYSEAIRSLMDALSCIDQSMAAFVHKAATHGWIDAEARDGKPNGGFCAPFLAEGESRISLTYDNSIDSARRLAHELGHAWHFYRMSKQPSIALIEDTFEMTSAETASIFFETVLLDHLLQNVEDHKQKQHIRNMILDISINYLMSIRSAFLFEKQVYEHENLHITAKELEELSLSSQQEAYKNSLSAYEPYKWVKYNQFFQADISFYNYPYTFGYLMSVGLLAKAKQSGEFAKTFNHFLANTGKIPLEELMMKSFDIDLKQPNFWDESVKRIVTSV